MHVKSVQKAFMIIEELDSAGELSLGELSERLVMDKATVHRLLQTIKESGYVNQNKENRKYSNGFKFLEIGNRVLAKTSTKSIARPFIEKLAYQTTETINLGVLVGTSIIYIDKIESLSTIKVGLNIGTGVPVYCSGMGKALMAFMSKENLDYLLDNITYIKHTKNTIVEQSMIMKALDRIKKVGYSIDDEEYVDGLICFGAPIFSYHGRPIAAISIACPKYRYDEKEHLNKYTNMLLETANEISKRLGFKQEN